MIDLDFKSKSTSFLSSRSLDHFALKRFKAISLLELNILIFKVLLLLKMEIHRGEGQELFQFLDYVISTCISQKLPEK